MKIFLFCLLSFSAHAGVLVTNDFLVEKGVIIEKGSTLVLGIEGGEITYQKADLFWYQLDSEVDTYFKGAEKALADYQFPGVIFALLRASIDQEPSTAPKAKQILQQTEIKLKRILDAIRRDSEKIAVARQALEDPSFGVPRDSSPFASYEWARNATNMREIPGGSGWRDLGGGLVPEKSGDGVYRNLDGDIVK
jgi:hypothetical protein